VLPVLASKQVRNGFVDSVVKENQHHDNTIFTTANKSNARVVMYESDNQNKATIAFYSHLNVQAGTERNNFKKR
jgi:hypothetical protein